MGEEPGFSVDFLRIRRGGGIVAAGAGGGGGGGGGMEGGEALDDGKEVGEGLP